MKNIMLFIGGFIILAGIIIFFTMQGNSTPSHDTLQSASSNNKANELTTKPIQKYMPFSITSPSFSMNGTIPSLFTCDGKNISPELNFSNIPEGTLSLALTMEDPDVPKSVRADGMWNHWVVWNIPPTINTIKEGQIAPGIIGMNTGSKMSYAGPCPPDREHRYIFTLYALDTMITLTQGSTKDSLLREITPHIINKATLVGLYNRQ